VKWGYLYQGQWYTWQRHRRGRSALEVPAPAFVTCLQNHDQIANSGRGERIHRLTSPGRLRALTALMLLAPGTPMLFQGQEFTASAPFLYFADHEPELATKVRGGRVEFLSQFPSIATPPARERLDDPGSLQTFVRCKLDLREREANAAAVALHRDLIALRKSDAAFRAQDRGQMHGAVLAPEAFLLRFVEADGEDRLLLVNLGRDLALRPLPEPLLAPPEGRRWRVRWSSEDVRYGGGGVPPVDLDDEGWRIPAHAAVALAAEPDPESTDGA
jgi:maltooligosyltrehalose trehalohydrolase